MELNMSVGSLRALIGLAGVVLLLVSWFSSDSGVARSDRQQRLDREWESRSIFKWGSPERDDSATSAHENLMGGFARLQMFVVGAALLAISIFWNKLGVFLGLLPP